MDVNRGDLINEIAKETGYTVVDLTRVFQTFEKIIIKHMMNLDAVRIMNGVRLCGVMTKPRKFYINDFKNDGREMMILPPHIQPKAEFSKWLKDILKEENVEVSAEED